MQLRRLRGRKGRFNKWRGGAVNRPDDSLISLQDIMFPQHENTQKNPIMPRLGRQADRNCVCLCVAFDAALCKRDWRLLSFYGDRISERKKINLITICSLSLHIYFSQNTAGRLPTSFGAAGRLVFTRVQGRKDGTESVITENKTRVTHKRERKWGSLVCEREEERERSREC